jgi:integrase
MSPRKQALPGPVQGSPIPASRPRRASCGNRVTQSTSPYRSASGTTTVEPVRPYANRPLWPVARAGRAAAVATFSPHDLRHRRISLLHRQGRSWAEVARFAGQRKLSITADVYTHVISDGREVDYAALVRTPVRTPS